MLGVAASTTPVGAGSLERWCVLPLTKGLCVCPFPYPHGRSTVRGQGVPDRADEGGGRVPPHHLCARNSSLRPPLRLSAFPTPKSSGTVPRTSLRSQAGRGAFCAPCIRCARQRDVGGAEMRVLPFPWRRWDRRGKDLPEASVQGAHCAPCSHTVAARAPAHTCTHPYDAPCLHDLFPRHTPCCMTHPHDRTTPANSTHPLLLTPTYPLSATQGGLSRAGTEESSPVRIFSNTELKDLFRVDKGAFDRSETQARALFDCSIKCSSARPVVCSRVRRVQRAERHRSHPRPPSTHSR